MNAFNTLVITHMKAILYEANDYAYHQEATSNLVSQRPSGK